AGLAVGAGDAHQLELAGRLAMEAAGNGRRLAGQVTERQHGYGRAAGESVRRLVGYRSGTGSNRLVDVIATIMTQAGHREEQIARFHLAAVGGQAGKGHQITLPLRKELLKLDHPRPSGRSGLGSSTCCSSL